MRPINIAFIDDHPVLLSGLSQIFSMSDEFNVVAVGKSAQDITEISKSGLVDVMVVDLSMPGRVAEAIARVAVERSSVKIVVFTASTSIDTAIAVLEAGALGFVLKGSPLDELSDAIRQVHEGETYLSPSVAKNVVAALQKKARAKEIPRVRFSKREEDVLRYLLQGHTNKEIAESLAISDKTVKHYMTVLIQKLDVRNRVEVVLAAQELDRNNLLRSRNSIN